MKKWSIYIMVGNLKVYLKRAMTTTEAVNWLQRKCKTDKNSNYFMHGTQVFCERR